MYLHGKITHDEFLDQNVVHTHLAPKSWFPLKKIILFIHLFLAVLGFCYCAGFSLVVVSRGHCPAVVCGLLIAMTSLVTAHGV